jgi:hypothetical protein
MLSCAHHMMIANTTWDGMVTKMPAAIIKVIANKTSDMSDSSIYGADSSAS